MRHRRAGPGQRAEIEVWLSRKMPWPMIERGESTPRLASHSTGVMPWRRVISWNSTTDCAAWIWNGSFRRFASAKLSLISSGEQVSICDGATMPDRRFEGCFAAASSTAIAPAIAAAPPSFSHSYSTTWPFFVNQRAERYIGASTARRPDAAIWSIQPSHGTERSTSVVTPESSSSEKHTVAQAGTPS
jgi:hypothetical protein